METSIEENQIDELGFVKNLKFCHPEGGVFDYFVDGLKPNAIYPEISGYYLSLISYLKKIGLEFEQEVLDHCERTVTFLNQIISEDGLPSKVFLNSTTSGKYYYFDLAMVGLGAINFYEVFGYKDALELALKIDGIIYHKYLDDDGVFKAHLETERPVSTWSDVFGPYHLKCSIFLHKVSKYSERCWRNTIINQLDFLFEKNLIDNVIYNNPKTKGYHSHPMCYFFEGLIYLKNNTDMVCEKRFADTLNSFFELEKPIRFQCANQKNETIRNDIIAQTLRINNLCKKEVQIEGLCETTEDKLTKILESSRLKEGSYRFGEYSNGEESRDINSWVSFMALQNNLSTLDVKLTIEFIV